MAVSEQVPANSSTGNGATTLFPYTFKILREEDLEVTVDGVPKTLNTDYIVSGVGNDAGGNVAFTTAPASGTTVIRRRNMAFVRTTDYQYQGELPNDVLNDDQDAPILMLQQVNEQVGRAIKVPVGEEAVGFLPAAADRAGKFMGFDASGNPVVLTGAGSGDTALRTDLAAGTGGALVGFTADVLGAVARDMLAKVRGIELTPQDCGAVGDGVTDDDVAFRKFAAAVHPRKRIPGGYTYKVNPATPYDFRPDDVVVGDGHSSLIDASGGSLAAGQPVFRIAAAFTLRGAHLSAAVSEGQASFGLLSVTGLSVGKVIVLYNTTDGSWSTTRNEYRAGEFIEIGNIIGSTIYPTMPLYDSYPDTVQVYELAGTGGRFANFRIHTQAAQVLGWQMDAGVNVSVEDVTVTGTTYTGGEFKRCYGVTYQGKAFQSTPSTDDEYGIIISNTQRGNVFMTSTGGRHPLAFGGGDYAGCVPCRGINVHGGFFGNLGPTGAGDLHGNTEDIKFFGATFANGTDFGGANQKFIGCRFRSTTNSGIAAYCGEPVKGTFEFSNCTFESFVDPNAYGYGVVNIGNAQRAKAAWRVVLTDCEFYAPGGTLFPIQVTLSGGTYPPDIIVNGGVNRCPGVTQFVRLQRSSGPATIGLVKVADVAGLPSGCSYVANAGSGLTVSRYELPEQSGTASVPVAAAASSYSATVTFRHPYPVPPVVITGLSTPTIGGDRSTSVASTVGADTFAAEVATCDGGNFAGVDTATVRWIARLAD